MERANGDRKSAAHETIKVKISIQRGRAVASCECGEQREFECDPASLNYLKRRSAVQQGDEWATSHVVRDHAGCAFQTVNELGEPR